MGLITNGPTIDENAEDLFHFPTSRKLLIVFVKNPVLGKCKTRLAATVGDNSALEIYKFLLEHTRKITEASTAVKHLYYSEAIEQNDGWDPKYFTKKLQQGADLGVRMKNAFQQGFNHGFEKIIIIGSDLYDLQTSDIDDAFTALESNDYVIGPSEDGGYYLLGMKRLNSELFENKLWGTQTVLHDTLADMATNNTALLPLRNDVDVYEDIAHVEAFQPFLNRSNHD